MENRKIHFHEKFVKSITDFHFYQNFLEQSTGKALQYLLILTVTLGVIGLVRPMYTWNSSVTQLIDACHEKMPEFTLKNGELFVEGQMPIIWGEDGSKVIIDTSGKTDESVLEPYDKAIFIGKDYLVQKNSSMETRKMNFAELKSFELKKADVEKFIPLLRGINILILFFGLPWFFMSKLVSALILAVIGLVLAGIKKADMKFGGLYKLSIYALTLPIVVKVLLSVAGLSIPHFWIIYYVIGAVYLWNAMSEKKATLDDGAGLV